MVDGVRPHLLAYDLSHRNSFDVVPERPQLGGPVSGPHSTTGFLRCVLRGCTSSLR